MPMKIVNARQMQQIDQQAQRKYGIPSIILMENAAIASAFFVIEMLKDRQRNVALFCGPGNNGGDGFACARHLINRGFKVTVYFAGKQENLSKDARTNYLILRKLGQKILTPQITGLKQELTQADLIVDALLGIGLKGKVKPPLDQLIKIINDSGKPVLSLDAPSGLEVTKGKVCGAAVKATRTITFGLPKKGFFNPQVKKIIGKLTVVDISLPRQLLF
ncbi:MAG: NAD(P)H-hydrate epimerase [Candidatus Omnitrophica bacterium]|nr:NAD(P)H-hydrate epimerase [Candidatus Omnitrophota bacterium]